MLNSYYRISVPEELSSYYYVSNSIKETADSFNSDVLILRDVEGSISSVKYYSPEGELIKEQFYEGNDICRINHYRGKKLYATEYYKNALMTSKEVYKATGILAHKLTYGYNKKNFVSVICKQTQNNNVRIEYKYDDFNRIIKRLIFKNDEKILEQYYRYDILDRVIEYRDDNQRIVVNKVSKKNELLSYIITDKMNNNITVENYFDGSEYVQTDLSINGHNTIIKDTSYVDNIMLKKPYTNDEDLDLIISNLFRSEDSRPTRREFAQEKNCANLIDKSIEYKVLPISMRKRILYNIAVS